MIVRALNSLFSVELVEETPRIALSGSAIVGNFSEKIIIRRFLISDPNGNLIVLGKLQ